MGVLPGLGEGLPTNGDDGAIGAGGDVTTVGSGADLVTIVGFIGGADGVTTGVVGTAATTPG